MTNATESETPEAAPRQRQRVDADVEREVTRWLEDEADLLDAADFRRWQALFADDGCYWIPSSADQEDPERVVSLVFDDRASIERRIARITSRLAYAMQPVAQSSRLIGNVRVDATPDGLLEARSRFVLTLSRRGQQHLLAGRLTHRLRRSDGALRIVLKRVDLVGADAVFENFTVVL